MKKYDTVLYENPAPRCPCMLVLDTSYSMDGRPIKDLNRGAKQFWQEVYGNEQARYSLEIGVTKFGGTVETVRPVESIHLDSKCPWPNLSVDGATPMGEAVANTLASLKERKEKYKEAGVSYFQPWMVLMTDGQPTDDYHEAARQSRRMAEKNELVVIAVGIGHSCDMKTLAEFCSDKMPPLRLKGLEFTRFFRWLSQSLQAQTNSVPGIDVPLPDPGDWALD